MIPRRILLIASLVTTLAGCGGDTGLQEASAVGPAAAGCYKGTGVKAAASAGDAVLVLDSVAEPGGRSFHARVVTGTRGVAGSWHRARGVLRVGILAMYPPVVYQLTRDSAGLSGRARMIPMFPGSGVDTATWSVSIQATSCAPVLARLGSGTAAQRPLPAEVRTELAAMGAADQAVRRGLTPGFVSDTARSRQMAWGDSARSRRLEQIVARYGWPAPSRVGEQPGDGAFLVLQHSPFPDFQQRVLPALDALARVGEVSGQEVALLRDRVLEQQGKLQRYGTQFALKEGQVVLDPIADAGTVDARRAELGLMPLASYRRMLEAVYGPRRPRPPATRAPGR